MAAHAHTTPKTVVESMLAGIPGDRIGALYAIRKGVVALIDYTADLCVGSMENPEVKAADTAFKRAIEQLWIIDRAIMAITPKSLDELRVQALIVDYESGDGEDFTAEHVSRLLRNIMNMAEGTA